MIITFNNMVQQTQNTQDITGVYKYYIPNIAKAIELCVYLVIVSINLATSDVALGLMGRQ